MFNQQILSDLSKIYPELGLTILAGIVLVSGIYFKKSQNITAYVSLAGVAGIFILTIFQNNLPSVTLFNNLYVIDPFSSYIKFLVIIAAACIIVLTLASNEFKTIRNQNVNFFYIFIGMLGAFIMASSVNLIMMFISAELLNISLYFLFNQDRKTPPFKYIVYSLVFSGIMLFGISILFGLTGTLNLYEISSFLSNNQINNITLLISVLMILSGLLYKISAVPFHFDNPDLNERMSYPICYYLSVIPKAAGFVILARFALITFQDIKILNTDITDYNILTLIPLPLILSIISALTITAGNLAALWQDNIKRLLSFLTIAQAGYILLGLTALTQFGLTSMLFYLVVYIIINGGIYFCALLIKNKFNAESVDELKGLGNFSQLLCICFGIFLLALAGLPLTAGFTAKFFVFASILDKGFLWLVIIGVINSVLTFYISAKIIRNFFFMKPVNTHVKKRLNVFETIILLSLLIPVIVLGIYFHPFLEFIQRFSVVG